MDILAIMNKATVNTHVQVLWGTVFGSFGQVPRHMIAEPYDKSMFSFVRSRRTVLKMAAPSLTPACDAGLCMLAVQRTPTSLKVKKDIPIKIWNVQYMNLV